jgi:hypothetical protein
MKNVIILLVVGLALAIEGLLVAPEIKALQSCCQTDGQFGSPDYGCSWICSGIPSCTASCQGLPGGVCPPNYGHCEWTVNNQCTNWCGWGPCILQSNGVWMRTRSCCDGVHNADLEVEICGGGGGGGVPVNPLEYLK